MHAEYVSYTSGIHSTCNWTISECGIPENSTVVFLKIVHTGSCIPVIVYTGYLLFLKVYTLRVLHSCARIGQVSKDLHEEVPQKSTR